jgi:hypothetical protein
MPASRRSWIPRPLTVLLIGTAVLIGVGVTSGIIYSRSRLAAIAYVRNHGGEVEFVEWSDSSPDEEWARPVHQVWLADGDACDLRYLSPLQETRRLYLLGCRFSRGGFDAICRFGRLEYLFVSSPGDVELEGFGHCPHLRSLACRSVRITDRGLREIAGLPLAELDLTQVPLTDEGLRLLEGSQMETLILCHTQVTDAGLMHLAGMRLRHLDLAGTRVTSAGLEHLRDLPLDDLRLDRTQIDDAGITTLKSLPLHRLSLRDTAVTDAGLQQLAGPRLRHLDLSGTRVTNAGLSQLRKLRLESLALNRTAVDDGGIAALRSLALQRLSLYDTRVTPEGLRMLAGIKVAVAVTSPPFTHADVWGFRDLKGIQIEIGREEP